MVSSQLSELSLNSSTWMFKAGHSWKLYLQICNQFLPFLYPKHQSGWMALWLLNLPLVFSCYSCFYWCFHHEAESAVKAHLQAYLKKKKILFLFCIQAEAIYFCSIRESLYCVFPCHILILVLSPLPLLWTAWRQNLCLIYVLFPVIAGSLPCAE